MTEAEGSRRLAAILAADVAGYSRLMQDDDRATVATLDACRKVFREHIQLHEGRVVDMAGDSILAVFEAATEAVRAAFDIQADLAKRNEGLPEHRRMRFRIGVNLGEVIAKSDGTVYGDGVNVAARLENIGEPGGVTVSGNVFDQVKNRLQLGFDFIGEQEVKNIAELVRAYRVVAEGATVSKTRPNKRKKTIPRLVLIGATGSLLLLMGACIWWAIHTFKHDAVLALPSGPSIAVLPFDNLGGDPSQEYFADGITEEIITALSRFQNLRVAARHNTAGYKAKAIETRTVGQELNVRYVLEGSVRRAPDAIRITAQLIEAEAGSHLWAETYQRPLTTNNLFEIQQEISASIAAAIAGDTGVMLTKAYKDSQGKPTTSLTAYECYMRFNEYLRESVREAHGPIRDCLEHAVELDPNYANAWASLANMYVDEDRFGFNTRPGALDRALKAAQRAVQLAPESQTAYDQLAFTYFYRGDLDAFLAAADRTIQLNPNNTFALADMGNHLAYVGRWDKGVALTKKALALDPRPPGWYYNAQFFDHYRKGEYEAALAIAQKMNMPDYVWAVAAKAAAYGQLGRAEEAKPDVRRILELDPDFEVTAREKRRRWFRFQEPLLDQFMDGLRKAGLKIPEKTG